MPPKVSPPEYYWPTEPDPEVLAQDLWTRTRRYFEGLRRSHFWRLAFRNWCYYHNLYFRKGAGFDDWTAITQLNEDGVLGVSVNDFRATLDLIAQYVTQDRPSIETRATKADNTALLNARFGDDLVENYLRDQALEIRLKASVIHALVLSEGFIYYPWNKFEGPREFVPKVDEATGQVVLNRDGSPKGDLFAKGDFSFCNPSVFDVVRDLGVKEWEHNRWVCVRTYENRWEIAKRARDNAEEKADGEERYEKILGVSLSSDAMEEIFYRIATLGAESFSLTHEDSDMIPVWNFYHRPTDAIPEGRFMQFTTHGVPISDPEDFPYLDDQLPIARVAASGVILTQFGYTPANDLQPLAEMVNAELSTIVTNHEGAGYNIIWVPEGGELKKDHLGQGVVVVEGGQQPPVAINFAVDSPGHFKLIELGSKFFERLSGMNSVVRGQPEASLKSGEALKVIESRAIQATSSLSFSYARAIEEAATFIIRTLRQYMQDDEERAIAVLGKNKRWQLSEFTKANLEHIDCVRADVANPLSRTVSGKFSIAEMLLKLGAISTPEELLTVLETGQIEPLLQADRAQLDLIHDENDKLVDLHGDKIEIDLAFDHHILHLKEHLSLVNSVEARQNPELMKRIYPHCMQHVQALKRPEVLAFQALLGHRMPQIPLAGMGAPLPGEEAGPGLGPATGPEGASLPPSPGIEPGESAPPGVNGNGTFERAAMIEG